MALLGAPWQLDVLARQTLFPAWRCLDPEGRGGLFQALALENQGHRPQFERVESPESPTPRNEES
jgi:23S rRNA (adenine2030-N6)-methyltransferase